MAEADPTVAAARREVLAARAELGGDVKQLEASARAAVDIKAKAKRNPAQVAAAAGGLGFIVLGGPGRVLRGIKRAVRGEPAPYPSKMLPEEVDRVVRRLGDDGEKVRGVLEREFANYVSEKKRADRRFWRNAIVGSLVAPAAKTVLTSAVKRAVTASDAASDSGKTGAPGSSSSSDRKPSRR